MRNTLCPVVRRGFLLPEQRHKKAGSSHPAPCADEPVYRLTGDGQESSNNHPFTTRLLRRGIDGAVLVRHGTESGERGTLKAVTTEP